MEEKSQLTKFTFYDLYAELMDTLTDEERGKLLRAMCAYAFEDAPPALTDTRIIQGRRRTTLRIFLSRTSESNVANVKRKPPYVYTCGGFL